MIWQHFCSLECRTETFIPVQWPSKERASKDVLAMCMEMGLISLRKKVTQSHYRPEVSRGFQEVKVPRLRDNSPGWW